MQILGIALSLLTAASSVLSFPEPDPVTGDTRVHDPSMCKDSSGTYFVFFHRPVWDPVPEDTNQFTNRANGPLWAPDCTYIDGTFHLFYAASTTGSRNSGIFYATSTTGQPNSFTDHGLVLSTNDNDQYNAIDPNDGQWHLSWGSSLLNTDGTVQDPNFVSLAQRTGSTDAEEASAVFFFDGNYYLFTSWDKCCMGTSSTYNIRVGRSSNVNGPYTDQDGVALLDGGGTQILASHDQIFGPGGQDIFADDDGPILVYHWYNATASYLGLNKLDFSSGWPVVV
ncbi:arabinanase [Irpex lacteus]|nr:arabinanase [Irpex lacteus]